MASVPPGEGAQAKGTGVKRAGMGLGSHIPHPRPPPSIIGGRTGASSKMRCKAPGSPRPHYWESVGSSSRRTPPTKCRLPVTRTRMAAASRSSTAPLLATGWG